jgi:hypothetical protein
VESQKVTSTLFDREDRLGFLSFLNALFVAGDLTGLKEWSSNFDADDVESFLSRVSARIDSGFGPGEVARTAKRILAMKHDADRWFSFRVTYKGAPATLKIYAFMDDIDSPDLALHASPPLRDAIAEEATAYFSHKEGHFDF